MRALVWEGPNALAVTDVPEPTIVDPGDAIVRVRLSSVCGSDLHLLDGFVPTVRRGDVLGHELVGDVVAVGPEVERLQVGQRVVVCSVVGCGRCWYCERGEWSLCDLSNPHPAVVERAYGHAGAAILGYSHAFGGLPGSHAQYVRVPFADHGCFPVPEAVTDAAAVFTSDAVPTGWMAADMAGIQPGDVVAIWGLGGVGQMAARAAQLLGAERVIGIDRVQDRVATAERRLGIETLDLEDADVADALADLTAGRGPDRCIEAVGMEATGRGLTDVVDRAAHYLRKQTGRPTALRQAIHACRKGGTVSVVGVFGGFVDSFPLGAAMNKGLTLRFGQQHGQRYLPLLLDHVAAGRLDPSYLLTHPLPLEEGPRGYELFKHKWGGCLRSVFAPNGFAGLTGLRTFDARSTAGSNGGLPGAQGDRPLGPEGGDMASALDATPLTGDIPGSPA